MVLSDELISQFAKITKDDKKSSKESTAYGTIVDYNGSKYVRLDGSELLTPISSTVDTKVGERVTVLIKNHTATVNGNTSSPAARTDDVKDIGDKIADFEIVIAGKVDTIEFNAQVGRIDNLTGDNVVIKKELTANKATIEELTTGNVTIKEQLKANDAEIEMLKTKKLDADIADIKYATVENLDVTNQTVHNLDATFGEFKDLATDKLAANDASIKILETTKLSTDDAEIRYADIDFTNIGKAAIEQFFSKSGMISDLVVGDGTITGKLVGVTIIGDLIEGGTVKADKLVIKGIDGLYYKLNTDGVTTEAEQTDHNSLNGSIITAKSITATKISVDDLVAFGATIGGFKITKDSIFSGFKESVNNTTRGIYFDNDGQLALGDSSNFLKYYKDADGKYKLEVSASSMKFSSSNTTVEEELNKIKDEVTTIVVVESSRGVMFKNSSISTTLIASIFRGSDRITDSSTLKIIMGDRVYLQWKTKMPYETEYTDIPLDDPRIGDNGFTLTINPGEVDTQRSFMCDLKE